MSAVWLSDIAGNAPVTSLSLPVADALVLLADVAACEDAAPPGAGVDVDGAPITPSVAAGLGAGGV